MIVFEGANLVQLYIYALIPFFFSLIWNKLCRTLISSKYALNSSFMLLYLAFCFLGLTVGLSTGLSRVAVVSVVIPGILSFLGGFTIYVFANQSNTEDVKINVLFSVAVFSFFVMYGIEIGSHYRMQEEDYQKSMDLYNSKIIKLYEYKLDSALLEQKALLESKNNISSKLKE